MLTVILNSASGGGAKVDANHLRELFRARGVEAAILLLSGRADGVMREAVSSPSSVIVAAGGDGTVSSVAAAINGASKVLGVLPLGTLNHFARDLQIPTAIERAVDIIVAGHVKAVDMGYVNERGFINNSSIGVYPGIVERREELRRRGYRKWTAFAIATATAIERESEVLVRVEVDGKRISSRTPFVFIGNNEYVAEGIHLGARMRLDGGRLHAYLAPRLRTRELPKAFVRALLGRAKQAGFITTLAASELWIEARENRVVRVSTDGEVTSLPTPLHYRVAPRALKVIVPAA